MSEQKPKLNETPDYGMSGEGNWIVVLGWSQGDEDYIGPFTSDEAAVEWASKNRTRLDGWFAVKMINPDDYDKGER